jgi:1-acyl-sn-glycerol-3-phosphate acyltransferase
MAAMRPWYWLHVTWIRAALRLACGVETEGLARVPATGGLIVAANHISFWDPPLVGSALRRECHYLAKEELFRVPVFGRVIASVNAIPIRRGMADVQGISRALEVLRRGGCLLMFPEGGRMKDGRLHRAKPGIGLIVAHARVPVVPVHVTGSNHIRRCIARRERVRIRFGAPLEPGQMLGGEEAEAGRALYRRAADAVMDAIARMQREREGVRAADAPGPTERGASH